MIDLNISRRWWPWVLVAGIVAALALIGYI